MVWGLKVDSAVGVVPNTKAILDAIPYIVDID